MPPPRRTAMAPLARYTALPLATLALTLSACARPASPPTAPPLPAASSSAGGASAGGGSPAEPTPSRPAGCVTDEQTVTARVGSPPTAACLAVGAILRVRAEPSPRQPWQPVSTSDGGVLSCASTPGPDGTVEATCRALRSGTAEVSTMTGPFAGDPHGPAQYLWRLSVTVVP